LEDEEEGTAETHQVDGWRARTALVSPPLLGWDVESLMWITEEQVKEMRSLYSRGEVTLESLGLRYGISFQHVGLIVQGKRWGHVV
jgi:hypothetical protein